MEKGDKIKDIRDNSIHIVESVDVYDEVTLIYTEGKKYIPIESVELISKVIEKVKSLIFNLVKPKNEKILTVKEFEKIYYENS